MSKRKKRTTIASLASTYGLPIERVRSIARAEGISDDNYNIVGAEKMRICAKLDTLRGDKPLVEKPIEADACILGDLEQSLRRCNERIRSLEKEIKEIGSQIQILSDEKSDYCNRYKHWQKEAASLEDRLKESERVNAIYWSQYELSLERINQLYRNLDAAEKESSQKEAECATLSSWLSDSLREIYQLKANVAGITTLQYWLDQQGQGVPAYYLASATKYLAGLLHRRFENATTTIFGSYEQPDLCYLSCERANELKKLDFGDDKHPSCYTDDDCAAYYCLRYEMGYAFEYFAVYTHLLNDLAGFSEPLEIASLGAGQGLDLWGLMYALTKLPQGEGLHTPIRWMGVDMEAWPNRLINQARGIYYIQDDITSYLNSRGSRMPQVLMFPKSICELRPEYISDICEWIRSAKLTMQTHYLIIVHTDRSSLSIDGHKNPSEDSSKAERLIEAFIDLGRRNGYRCTNGGHNQSDPFLFPKESHREWFGDATVELATGAEPRWLNAAEGETDPAFAPFGRYGEDSRIFDMVKMLYVCCEKNEHQTFDIRNLLSQRFSSCNNASCAEKWHCTLQRYPRVKLENMAYHFVRLTKSIFSN